MKDFQSVEVMILDLDRYTIDALEAALHRIGIKQVRHAGTTVELVQQLEERPADLLFLGDQLPHMPVIKTVAALRELPCTASLPILWSTHTRNPRALRNQIAAGLAGVIWQPASDTQLRRAIRRALHIELSRDLISVIKLASFFQEFSLDELREVLKESLPCRYAPGEVIIQKGEPSDSFFVLLKGEVEVFLPSANGDSVIATIPAGHSFGEMGILETDTRSAHCIATQESIVLEIDSRILLHDQEPVHGKIMAKVAMLLATRLRAMNQQVRGESRLEEPSDDSHQLLERQIGLRLHAMASRIPKEIRKRVTQAVLERWERPPHHTPLHLVVASPWGEEGDAEIFHDLPLPHQLIENTQRRCHGSFLTSQERLDDYLADPDAHLSDHTLFFVYEGTKGEMTQALRKRFPHNLIITTMRGVDFPQEEPEEFLEAPWKFLEDHGDHPWRREDLLLLPDLFAYFQEEYGSLFGIIGLLTGLATPIEGEKNTQLEAVFGMEG